MSDNYRCADCERGKHQACVTPQPAANNEWTCCDGTDPFFPCTNGCIRKGTDYPMPITHGNVCDREFFAMKSALQRVAEVVEHVVSLVDTKGTNEANVQTTREAPLPFNAVAFNDANELYQRLVYWANHWAKMLGRQAPGAAARAWRAREGFIVGLPNDVTPAAARYASATMAIWLQAHLDDICKATPADDVAYFHDELADVFRVAARWPFKMTPRFAKIPCPGECQGRIAVYPPEEYEGHMRINCEKCHRIFGEDDFEHEVRLFKQLQDEIDSPRKVANHLLRKYAPAEDVA